MHSRASEYQVIKQFVDRRDLGTRSSDGFRRLKDHAFTLAKQSLTEEMRSLANTPQDPNDPHRRIQMQHILKKLKTLILGSISPIGAIEDPELGMCTTPEKIAKALQKHWGKVFGKKEIDGELLTKMAGLSPKDQSQ